MNTLKWKPVCGALLVCGALEIWTALAPAQVVTGGGGSGANPTATAGPTAVNGAATTFMRSDAAPAVQKGSAAQFGIMECDNSTVTCPGGVLSAAAGATGANPTATAGPTATNGVATTFMRSDAAPAVQSGTNAVQGIVECDTTTINCSGGTITTKALPGLTGGSNPAAGLVGEFVSSSVAPGSAVSVSTGAPKDITTITLSAGNWDIAGVCAQVPASTTVVTAFACGLNSVSNTFPPDASTGASFTSRESWTGTGTNIQTIGTINWHVNPTGSTTYHLVGNSVFTVSTNAMYGFMRAIRTP